MTTPAAPRRDETNPMRIWAAILVGTLLQVVGYGSFLLAVVATQSDTPEAAGPAFALGFVMVPVVFAAVAFISGHRQAPMATLRAMGLWLLVTLPLGLVHPVTGLCAGYGIGGAVTLRRDGPLRPRLIAVALATAYTTLLLLTIPAAAVLTGAVAPLLAVKIGDWYAERASRAGDG